METIGRCKDAILSPPNHSPQDLRHRHRMHHDGIDPAPKAVRLMKDAELAEHGGAVIVDLLARKPVVVVERVNAAKRKLDVTAGRRQASPGAQVAPADDDFEHDRCFAGVAPLHVDLQVGQGVQPQYQGIRYEGTRTAH